jgi:hypothetical protein
LAKNWLTQRSINFCLATQLLFSARHYKFGDVNNNEHLIKFDFGSGKRISNNSSSPSRTVTCTLSPTLLLLKILKMKTEQGTEYWI